MVNFGFNYLFICRAFYVGECLVLALPGDAWILGYFPDTYLARYADTAYCLVRYPPLRYPDKYADTTSADTARPGMRIPDTLKIRYTYKYADTAGIHASPGFDGSFYSYV
jgi:hypothetical protein